MCKGGEQGVRRDRKCPIRQKECRMEREGVTGKNTRVRICLHYPPSTSGPFSDFSNPSYFYTVEIDSWIGEGEPSEQENK